MKITKITVNVGQVFNLGNYQSARIEAGAEATIEEGEDPKPAYEKLYLEAKAAFAKMAANFIPKKENKT
jgi:hypothetical protein